MQVPAYDCAVISNDFGTNNLKRGDAYDLNCIRQVKACKPVTEKIKQSEVLRMKGTLKRVMSGVLSVITIASAVAQPMTAYAAEPEKAASSFEAQYPELEAVKDKLAEDEILTANDYSIDYGSDFDIKVDFSGIEGINDAKVKVELYEAKNEEEMILTHTRQIPIKQFIR